VKKRHTREDSGIRLDRVGRWWHDDEPVEHPKIIEAFNRGLEPGDDGRFILRFGHDWCFVEVEDAAYAVVSVEANPLAAPTLLLSDRTTETLAARTLASDADGALVCRVKQGRAKARFSRAAQVALGELLEERDGALWLRCGAEHIRVP
jgi:hypothetical protein